MDSFTAECWAILEGVEFALERNWKKLWIETDCSSAVHVFGNDRVPWMMKKRWQAAIKKMEYVYITSTWREVNFAADTMANHGYCNVLSMLKRFLTLSKRNGYEIRETQISRDIWMAVV
ncbi:hypothetical protein ACHQM5_016246 [Ranunculus cassubicifolius]